MTNKQKIDQAIDRLRPHFQEINTLIKELEPVNIGMATYAKNELKHLVDNQTK